MDEPPPLPKLVLPSDGPSDSPDPMTSFEVSHRRKHFHEIRSSLRSSSASIVTPSSGSSAADGDGASEHGRIRLRDRLTRRTSSSRSIDDDHLDETTSVIMLQDSRSANDQEDDEDEKDLYRWAVMIENQRGVSVFGLSKYSSSSLMPNDPPSFTVPPEYVHDAETSITPHNLSDYQLPDASWVWVSKSWLVQMGGNGSSVDGYEYNWWFRQKGWRATPGKFSAGAWVRRRQWVRLMMRPARSASSSIHIHEGVEDDDGDEPSNSESPLMVWSGDKDVDWIHARHILRDLRTDGQHISMWRQWLSQCHLSHETTKGGTQIPLTSSSQRDCAKAVLDAYISDVLSFFVFPESRHLFIDMLASLKIATDVVDSDFYSLNVPAINLHSSTASLNP